MTYPYWPEIIFRIAFFGGMSLFVIVPLFNWFREWRSDRIWEYEEKLVKEYRIEQGEKFWASPEGQARLNNPDDRVAQLAKRIRNLK